VAHAQGTSPATSGCNRLVQNTGNRLRSRLARSRAPDKDFVTFVIFRDFRKEAPQNAGFPALPQQNLNSSVLLHKRREKPS
jgi:hypothetical protein